MQTTIEWIDPKDQPPPFDTAFLALFGGQLRHPTGIWEKYIEIQHVVMLHDSPNGEGREDEYYEFSGGDARLFPDFQFHLCSVDRWRMGFAEDYLDWYSDAIVRWAPMPDFSSVLVST